MRTPSNTSTNLQGPGGFIPQEFSGTPTNVTNPTSQVMTPTQAGNQGEQVPNFQRGPMNMQNIQPNMKGGMHPGGPISPMNMGPGGMGNMQGPFPQGGPFPGGQGNVPGGMGGMNFGMNMPQGNMMQPNMMQNMNANPNMGGPNMGPNMGGPGGMPGFNMNPSMQNFPGPGMMHGGMGPNQNKMGSGGFMGGPMNMGQFPDQGNMMKGQGQPQKMSEFRNDLIAMINKSKGSGNQPQGFIPQNEPMHMGQNKMGGGLMMGEDMGNSLIPNSVNKEIGMNMGSGMQRENEGDMGMRGDMQQNQQFGGHMMNQPMMQQHQHRQQGMQQGGAPVQDQGQGGALTGINSLTQQEKNLLKEIMENKKKKDPRCAQRIKEILMKHPRIKEFIMNQNKAQQQQQQQH